MKNAKTPFKICTSCQKVWETRSDFIHDEEISLTAYQASLRGKADEGLFVFEHQGKNCQALFGIAAFYFLDLYNGQVYYTSSYATKECFKHCLDFKNFSTCNNICSKAHIRKIAIEIINQKKKAA